MVTTLALLLALALGVSPAAADTGLTYKRVAEATQPTSLISPPGYPRMLVVTERTGKVKISHRGKWRKKPLLNLSKKVSTFGFEQGLLGLAFAPDFRKTGRFYVNYTARNGDSIIEEYRTFKGQPARRIIGKRRLVLRIPKVNDRGNHNGGKLAFLGGLLYIAIGDGNDPGDGEKKAQDLNSLRGKILRIDPRPDPASSRAYRIPSGNPFVDAPGRGEIYSYGLRNPHNFSFHRPAGGPTMIAIADVGQGRFEELNYLPLGEARGANFGWNVYEGNASYDCGELCPGGGSPLPDGELTWPQLVYSHDEGCAVIGGPVIEDPRLGGNRGRLIYGDFCANRIRTAAPAQPVILDDRPAGFFLPPGKNQHSALNGFGVDGKNRVYALSNKGGIFRIDPRPAKNSG